MKTRSRKKASKQEDPTSFSGEAFFFAKLPGISGRIMWPVQMTSQNSEPGRAVVYCSCDNALFTVDITQLTPYPNNTIESKAIDYMRKRKMFETLQKFEEDVKWIKSGGSPDIQSSTRTDKQQDTEAESENDVNFVSDSSSNNENLPRQTQNFDTEAESENDVNFVRDSASENESLPTKTQNFDLEAEIENDVNFVRDSASENQSLPSQTQNFDTEAENENDVNFVRDSASENESLPTQTQNFDTDKQQDTEAYISDSDMSFDNDDEKDINFVPDSSSDNEILPTQTQNFDTEAESENDVNFVRYSASENENSTRQTQNFDTEAENDVNFVRDSASLLEGESFPGPTQDCSKRVLHLTEQEKVRDLNYPEVIIKKYRKSNIPVSGSAQAKKKVNNRIYDNYHACYVCGQLVSHISVHAKSHRTDSRVQEVLKMKHPDWTDFRKRGDSKHNAKVVEKKEGQLLIARRPNSNECTFDMTDYGPCPNCQEWHLLKNVKQHYKKCCRTSKDFCPSDADLKMQSMCLAGYITTCASDTMKRQVFPSMRKDEISKVAMSDGLILALGESWLRRCVANKEKRGNYASQHMRLAAKLLIKLQEIEKGKGDQGETEHHIDMESLLTVSKFDDIVKATLACCIQNMDDMDDLHSPSNAIKLKYDIVRMVDAKWSAAVKLKKTEVAQDCLMLMKLFKKEWADKVTRLARSILNRRQFETMNTLPSPEDVEAVTRHLQTELYKTEPSPVTFQRLVTLSLARLMLFNRRRSGEIEVIQLDRYVARTSELSDLDESLAGRLSEVEKLLLTSQEMMTVRGKNSRPVPVIIPADTKLALAYISSGDGRKAAGVPVSNRYLFPNTVGTYARAYNCLKTVCEEVGLRAPERITSVNMRKYTATLTQTMNLKSNEFDWLLNHLGHTSDVHKQHYRQMSGLLERVYVSKLLLVQDMNMTNKYANQDLMEMDIRDLVAMPMEGADTSPADQLHAEPELEPGPGFVEEEDQDMIVNEESSSSSEAEHDPEPKRKKTKFTRRRWSDGEIAELKEFFEEYLERKITPKQKAVEKAKKLSKKNKGQIHLRANHLIIKKISAMNHKLV